jgi:hypothetical protein
MKPKFKVWVTFGELKFGDGRARLLEVSALAPSPSSELWRFRQPGSCATALL